MPAVALQRALAASIHAAAVLARLRTHFEGGPGAGDAFLNRAIFAGGCSVRALHALGVGASNRAVRLSRYPVSSLGATFGRELIAAPIASRTRAGWAGSAISAGSAAGSAGRPGSAGPAGRVRMLSTEHPIRLAAGRKAREDQKKPHRESNKTCDHFPTSHRLSIARRPRRSKHKRPCRICAGNNWVGCPLG